MAALMEVLAAVEAISVLALLLPSGIETGAFRCDQPQIVVALGQQRFAPFGQWQLAGLIATAARRARERQVAQRHRAVLLGQAVARELDRRLQAQRGEALLVHVEPAAVFCRAAGVSQL